MKPTTYSSRSTLERALKGENRETVDWMIYDSQLTTASVTQTLQFFQNSIGSVGKARTNIKTPGMLTAPQGLLVYEIGCRIINIDGKAMQVTQGATANILPLAAMFGAMYFDIRLEPAVLYEGHGFQFWDQLLMAQTQTTAALSASSNSPSAVQWKNIKLKNPIVIPPNRSFSVALTLTTPAAALGYLAANTCIFMFFKGLLYRNV